MAHQPKKNLQNLSRFIMQLQKLEKQPRTYGEAGTLTPGEINTIDAIGPEGVVLMSELADRLQVTRGAATQVVLRLERKRLVSRTPCSVDSRCILVSLTDAGRSAYQAHHEMRSRFYREMASQLTEQEIEVFRSGLEKLCRFLQQKQK